MSSLGFSGGECGAVLRLLAFMLKIGNVHFEPQHNIDGTIGTRIQHAHGAYVCGRVRLACPAPV